MPALHKAGVVAQEWASVQHDMLRTQSEQPFGRAGPKVCKVSFGGRGCVSVGSRLFEIPASKIV